MLITNWNIEFWINNKFDQNSNLVPIVTGKQITNEILRNEKVLSVECLTYFNSIAFLFSADMSWNGALKWPFLIYCSFLC